MPVPSGVLNSGRIGQEQELLKFWKSNLCYYTVPSRLQRPANKGTYTGHHSLEALHKYKRTGPDQQYKVAMALLPQIEGKENKKPLLSSMDDDDDDDDFIPMKKKPKIKPEDLKAMFEHSSLQNCTINIQIK